ncbi:MAG: hypothetical protein IKZ82_13350 [Clostridia bacterium]|nr:hypothetical protein [Clostridia bacterium]
MVFLLTCACCVFIESAFLMKVGRLETRTELPIVVLANVFTFIISNILLRRLLHTGMVYDLAVLIMIILVNLASIAVEYLIFSAAFERGLLGFGVVSAANAIAFVLSFPITYFFAIVLGSLGVPENLLL